MEVEAPRVHLTTERLVLRRFTPADIDLLVELDSDPAVMRYLTGGAATPRAQIEEYLARWISAYDRRPGYGFWAAIEKASGDFIGWFHFRPLPEAAPGEVELGYRLRQAAWGKGYGTEVSRALIDQGFRELGAQRVVASTYVDNIGSRRVMEKCGLTLVRTFRPTPEENAAHGIDPATADLFPGDDVEYALDKATWERQQAASP